MLYSGELLIQFLWPMQVETKCVITQCSISSSSRAAGGALVPAVKAKVFEYQVTEYS